MDSDETLYKRDYSEPTGEDCFNKELMPAAQQVKNFGKKGRSKWTHLSNEDTTAFTYGWGQRSNTANYHTISKMGGMRGDLDHPNKRYRK